MFAMEELLLDIIGRLRRGSIDPAELAGIIRAHNDNVSDVSKHLSKKKILPFYLGVKANDPARWDAWGIDEATESALFDTLRMKPRRTASGVATITVITKPQPCTSNCLYCPNDLRMPKSYLSNEPACQRAERNFFDPFLQVASRMRALVQMGHSTDKVELIVLGGTWSDYPRAYQVWFAKELFRALNEWPVAENEIIARRAAYERAGFSSDPDVLADSVYAVQSAVDKREISYNQGFHQLYDANASAVFASEHQVATMKELEREQRRNETAAHRVVGLVVETRPDTIDARNLTFLRALGCTKIQIGVQSTRQEILDANRRATSIDQVKRAFFLIRLFGFKIHSHLMVNLVGATPEADKRDFETFVTDSAFLPDEIKLYPCALVQGTDLVGLYEKGSWRPYTQDELLDVLVSDVLRTPPYIRISRMIRDISADDILAGNKKTNLRQMVEGSLRADGSAGGVQEIRYREINLADVDVQHLSLEDFAYRTAFTDEHFLQWVAADNRIAGFLRLSLPRWEEVARAVSLDGLPVHPGEAMIREVHVYGQAAHLGKADAAAQHQGLGRQLIERACKIAADAGFAKINVVSSVGTREYYRARGFADAGLYQQCTLR